MRKVIFWMHLLAGVSAGLVIFLMSVTGVLLMYEKQVIAWADGYELKPEPGAPRLPMPVLLSKVDPGTSPTAITLRADPGAPVAFAFGREKTVFVNPYTGEVLGEGCTTARAFFQTMIAWHRWLGATGENRPIGKAITGACNLAFLFLVVSGFYLWWPRHWSRRSLRAVTWFERGLKGKARDWNWHNVIGFWSALPLFVLVFTAVFFSYPWATNLLYKATGEEPPAPRSGARGPEKMKDSARPDPQGWTAALAKAEAQMPGWKSISLRVPSSDDAPLVFTIDRGNGTRPDLRGTLTLDPQTGETRSWETISDLGTARKIRSWIRWIHTGEAGGLIGQTIAGLASAGGALLAWTGLALAWRRFRAWKLSP